METNRVYLDFHIFDIPEGVEFLLVERPIEPLINHNRDRAMLEVKVGREIIPFSLVRSCLYSTDTAANRHVGVRYRVRHRHTVDTSPIHIGGVSADSTIKINIFNRRYYMDTASIHLRWELATVSMTSLSTAPGKMGPIR